MFFRMQNKGGKKAILSNSCEVGILPALIKQVQAGTASKLLTNFKVNYMYYVMTN